MQGLEQTNFTSVSTFPIPILRSLDYAYFFLLTHINVCTGCTASHGLVIIFVGSAAFSKYFAQSLSSLNDVMDRMVRVEVHAIQFNTLIIVDTRSFEMRITA